MGTEVRLTVGLLEDRIVDTNVAIVGADDGLHVDSDGVVDETFDGFVEVAPDGFKIEDFVDGAVDGLREGV